MCIRDRCVCVCVCVCVGGVIWRLTCECWGVDRGRTVCAPCPADRPPIHSPGKLTRSRDLTRRLRRPGNSRRWCERTPSRPRRASIDKIYTARLDFEKSTPFNHQRYFEQCYCSCPILVSLVTNTTKRIWHRTAVYFLPHLSSTYLGKLYM